LFSIGRLDQGLQYEAQENQIIQTLRQSSNPYPFEQSSLTEKMEQRGDGKFKILSIDGGGIRGIIPLKILTVLEEHIGPISNTFDLIAGTSTGGIIALALTASPAELKASDILRLYQTRSNEMFLPNPHRMRHTAIAQALPRICARQDELIKGLIDDPLYTNEGLNKLASELFERTLMRDTRTNVLIPAVDITNMHQPTTCFLPIEIEIKLFCLYTMSHAQLQPLPPISPIKKLIHRPTWMVVFLAIILHSKLSGMA
jgi:hypothetical protein